jgi:hypothetical protein
MKHIVPTSRTNSEFESTETIAGPAVDVELRVESSSAKWHWEVKWKISCSHAELIKLSNTLCKYIRFCTSVNKLLFFFHYLFHLKNEGTSATLLIRNMTLNLPRD